MTPGANSDLPSQQERTHFEVLPFVCTFFTVKSATLGFFYALLSVTAAWLEVRFVHSTGRLVENHSLHRKADGAAEAAVLHVTASSEKFNSQITDSLSGLCMCGLTREKKTTSF